MNPKTRSRLFQVLRIALGVVALAYVINQLNWNSTATLKTGETRVVLEEGENTLTVDVDGDPTRIPCDEFAPRNDKSTHPKIRYGLKDVIRGLDWRFALIGLMCFAPCPLLLAFRIKWLLDAQQIRMTLWELVRITYAGNFLNFLLPGMSGGDVMKAYYASKHTTRKHEAVAVVFLDRVLGLTCLILLGGMMVLVGWGKPAFAGIDKFVGGITLLLVVGALLYFSHRIRRWIRYDWWIERIPMGAHIRRLDQAALLYRDHRLVIVKCMLITLGLQTLSVTAVFFGGWALHMVGDKPLSALVAYLVYVPLGWIIAAIPITPQGLGIMEEAYIRFFVDASHYASSESQAFFLAMIGRLIQMFWSLPGAWVVFGGAYRSTSENLAELTSDDDGGDVAEAGPTSA